MKRAVFSTLVLLVVATVCGVLISGCEKTEAPVQQLNVGQDVRTPEEFSKTTATFLMRLNPTTDPNRGCTDWVASGTGVNGTPIWVGHNASLAAYAYHNVRIQFRFSTRDERYNKFEGWYLDDINIDGWVDDVESGAGSWTATGFWHIDTYRSYSATHSWRYANAAGNYQGITTTNVCSDATNSGVLTSQVIGLGANPSLAFRTLWQIEAVDPNAFDFMEVWVDDLGVIPAKVDIKPGGCPNPLNVNANGSLPVAIVGAGNFDVSQVDISTVTLQTVAQGPQAPVIEDVATPFLAYPSDCMDCNALGADQVMDLSLKFDIQTLVTALGTVNDGDCVRLTLRGKLLNGLNFVGYDVVKIIKKK